MYHSFSLLKEECSNNEAEYEALIFGLLLALSMEVRSLRAYGDSQLITVKSTTSMKFASLNWCRTMTWPGI